MALGWESLGRAIIGLLAGAVVAAPLGALLARRLSPGLLVRRVGGLLLLTSVAGFAQVIF